MTDKIMRGDFMRRMFLAISLAILSFSVISNPAWAQWLQEGGGNVNATSNATTYPSLASGNSGTAWVAWQEQFGKQQIYVKHFDGSNWVQDGGGYSLNISSNCDAFQPSVAISGNTPYVAWHENDTVTPLPAPHVYMKHWDGNSWQQDGSVSTNINGNSVAHLAVINSNPYVIYFEKGMGSSSNWMNFVYVKHWSGSMWVLDGNSLNAYTSYGAGATECNITTANGIPYICWCEPNGTVSQFYVKYLSGSTWLQFGAGGSLNTSPSSNASSPGITVANGVPYVCWRENSNAIYVKHWTGSAWQQDGGNLSDIQSPYNPSISAAGGTVYVTWSEMTGNAGSAYDIFVKHWDGGNWVQDGGRANIYSYGSLAHYPNITVIKGVPTLVFTEQTTGNPMVFVKQWPANISSVCPGSGVAGSLVKTTISSSGFIGTPQAMLSLNGATNILSSSVVENNNFNQYTFTFNLSGATPNGYDVKVVTSEGATFTAKQAFQVAAPQTAPVAWSMSDCGLMGSLTMTAATCGLTMGDADQDGHQELYVANLDQCIYRVKKVSYNWNIAPSPTTAGVQFCQLLATDGTGDQNTKIYATNLNNQIYQISGATMQTASLAAVPGALGLAKMDLDHDGVAEIYAAGVNGISPIGGAGQLRYNGTSWNMAYLTNGPNYRTNALVAGDGNNDGVTELYSANADYNVYQYVLQPNYAGGNVNGPMTVVGSGNLAMTGVTLGDGDNDGQKEVYASNMDGNIYQFRWGGSSWNKNTVGQPGGGAMYGVAVADAENIGANQVYAACGDGHIYEYKYASGSWTRYDLGNTPTAFYALAIGNANNDAGNTLKVYALGQNNHVFEFTAASVPAVTSTPTPGLTVTPTIAIPQNYFKVFHSQINPMHGEQARIRWTQPQAGPVSITIYNLLGDKVAAPLAGVSFAAGEYHEVDWNGRTQKGAVAGSGIYIVVVDTPGNETRGKVAVIK